MTRLCRAASEDEGHAITKHNLDTACTNLELWKASLELKIKTIVEGCSEKNKESFAPFLMLESEELAGYVQVWEKRMITILRRFAFKTLDEIFTDQVKAAKANMPDAAADKKAGAEKDEVSTIPVDDNDKAITDQANGKTKTPHQSDDSSGPALAAITADMQKLSTAPAPAAPVAATEKSEIAVPNVKSKGAQRKKKSGLESSALAKAWLAGDD